MNPSKCRRPECDPQLEHEPLLVRCKGCGLAGYVARAEDEAIELWNKNVAPHFVGNIRGGYWATRQGTHDTYPEGK